ncbi:hypothetical protein [Aureivirga sp. CE67]|uniref:hypothetical protein n=1 Tax=Aureivirga sp. CE67 TaxID=1788983 RepID=UPI0018CBD541|nr:hypothetical protein [Aureivirga sp. CE67]
MVEIIGFLALIISVIAVSMTNIVRYRIIHLASSIVYVLYGFMISAFPIIIGALLFMTIHLYHLWKLRKTL